MTLDAQCHHSNSVVVVDISIWSVVWFTDPGPCGAGLVLRPIVVTIKSRELFLQTPMIIDAAE